MTKAKKNIRVSKHQTESELNKFNFEKFIPHKFHTLSAIILIAVLFLIYFSPMYFGNKTFQSGDIITIKSMQAYAQQDKDGFTLWNPYIFGGLPAYATATAYRWWDFIGGIYSYGKLLIGKLFSVDYAVNTFNLFLIALTSFFFMRSRKASTLISVLVSLATTFSTGIIVFLYIGHITKMISLAAFPLILMMLLRFNKKIKLLDVLIITIFLHLVVIGAHVQIIFYIFLSVAVYYIFYFIKGFANKNNFLVKQLFKSAIIFIAAAAIALLMSFDSYAQLWEYNKYSTRGTESILEKTQASSVKDESDFYQYATNWSFSVGEILTFVVPSYYGFGKSTYSGPLTKEQPVEVNTYFGQMPFVDVPMYMGVVIFFLALFGIYSNWKNTFIQYLTVLIFFFLILSFGRNLPVLYDLFYNYFPFFNKFRVPSMTLTILQMSMPILAGYGVMKIISLRKEEDQKTIKLIKNSAIVFASLFVLSLMLSSGIKEWFIGRIQQAGQQGEQLKPLYDYMSNMFASDLIINMALVSLTFALAFAFIRKKLSSDLMVLGIVFLLMFDLLRIDLRAASYTEASQTDEAFKTPAYISAIKNQNDKENYRIVNFKKEGLGTVSQNSNFNVYFLVQDFSGYSGVKPRTYQDYIDVVGAFNLTMFRMLNVKYIVVDKPANIPGAVQVYNDNTTVVYNNTNALPRAFLVDSLAKKSSIEILNAVKNNQFDPKKVAYLEDQIMQIDKPDSSAAAMIETYKDEYIKINVNASGKNFLFLGDTYYPKGWKAFIDGNETEIYKANHGFRGVVVPKGKHVVEFKFDPKSFEFGKYISLGLNITITALFIFAVFIYRKDEEEISEQEIREEEK